MDKGNRNEQVLYLLKNFRSFEFAAMNCGRDNDTLFPTNMYKRLHERRLTDGTRYNRIVNMIRGAVDHVLDDDQKIVITFKYLERNTLTIKQISAKIGCDPSTVSRWHTEAIKTLVVALEPLTSEEIEITTFEHMFDEEGIFLNRTA